MTALTPSEDPTPPPSSFAVGRRGLLGGLALGSVALGAGVVGGFATDAVAGSVYRKRRLTVEVACLAELWREAVKSNPATDGDFRAPFVVEGWIYPEGTILGDGFRPVPEGSLGRWFCRGSVIIDAVRPEPHTTTHQDFVFGTITPEALFPTNTLATAGLEGTVDRAQRATRAVIGGTGEFLGATGQQTQQLIATNTSLFADGTNEPGPCWRVEFDLRILD